MNAGQYIYFGLGLFFIVIGAVSLVDSPRRRAKRAAEIDTRVVTDGEITKYRLESDARTRGIPDDGVTEYRAQIEYTVDGHRYQIKAARAVSKPGALNEKVRVAYQRAMPSDAIEVREDIADDRAFAKFSIGIGLLLLVAGWFDWKHDLSVVSPFMTVISTMPVRQRRARIDPARTPRQCLVFIVILSGKDPNAL